MKTVSVAHIGSLYSHLRVYFAQTFQCLAAPGEKQYSGSVSAPLNLAFGREKLPLILSSHKKLGTFETSILQRFYSENLGNTRNHSKLPLRS